MPAYTHRFSGAVVTSTSGAALSPSPGTHGVNYQTGDLLLLCTGGRTAGQTVSVTNWTQLVTVDGSGVIAIWGRIADGSADDAPTVDWSGTTRVSAWIESFYGDVYTDMATIVHQSNTLTDGASLLIATPVMDTGAGKAITVDNCLIVLVGKHNSNATSDVTAISPPATTTLRQKQIVNASNGIHMGCATKQQTTAADWSTTNWSFTETTPQDLASTGVAVALKTAVATAGGGKRMLMLGVG